jgi:hypothetical protein
MFGVCHDEGARPHLGSPAMPIEQWTNKRLLDRANGMPDYTVLLASCATTLDRPSLTQNVRYRQRQEMTGRLLRKTTDDAQSQWPPETIHCVGRETLDEVVTCGTERRQVAAVFCLRSSKQAWSSQMERRPLGTLHESSSSR